MRYPPGGNVRDEAVDAVPARGAAVKHWPGPRTRREGEWGLRASSKQRDARRWGCGEGGLPSRDRTRSGGAGSRVSAGGRWRDREQRRLDVASGVGGARGVLTPPLLPFCLSAVAEAPPSRGRHHRAPPLSRSGGLSPAPHLGPAALLPAPYRDRDIHKRRRCAPRVAAGLPRGVAVAGASATLGRGRSCATSWATRAERRRGRRTLLLIAHHVPRSLPGGSLIAHATACRTAGAGGSVDAEVSERR